MKVQLKLRIESEQLDAITALAKLNGTSRNELVTEAITSLLSTKQISPTKGNKLKVGDSITAKYNAYNKLKFPTYGYITSAGTLFGYHAELQVVYLANKKKNSTVSYEILEVGKLENVDFALDSMGNFLQEAVRPGYFQLHKVSCSKQMTNLLGKI